MKGRKNISHVFIMIVLLAMPSVMLAQNQKVKLTGKNITLKMAFAQIEKQTGLSVDYDAKILDVNRELTIIPNPDKLSGVLSQLLKGINCSYVISRSHVIITRFSTAKQSAGMTEESNRTKNISGLVTDTNGEPIIGANIIVKGEKIGTISDGDGRFRIQTGDKNILRVSCIGFQSQDIALNGKNSLTVYLLEDQKALDEIVVVGYGTQKRSDLTGSVSTVKVSDLVKTSDASISQMLKGKAAGVTVLSTNAGPGGGVDIRVRGASSIAAGNEPLYVIDGFPISNSALEPGSPTQYSQGDRNPLNSLNPNDVESIEILKDASATSIYGARASNGVILITTKRGNKGLKLNYDGSFTTQVMSQPFEMLNAHDYMVKANLLIKEDWLRTNKIAPFGTADPMAIAEYTPRYTQAQIDNVGEGTNWWNLITRPGLVNNHNVSATYGNDQIRSYASLGYYRNDGVIKGSTIERISTKINLDWTINKYLISGISFLGSRINNNNIQAGNGEWGDSGMLMSAFLFDPTVSVKDSNGKYNEMSAYTNLPNPVSFLDISDNTKQIRNLTNFFLTISPIKDLSFKVSIGDDSQSSVRKIYYPKTFLVGYRKSGEGSIGQINEEDLLFDAVATYKFNFKKHSFNTMLGYSYQKFKRDDYSLSGTNFFTDVFTYNNMGVACDKPVIGSSYNQSVLASYFGRINYAYKDRYLLTINARYDGSDKFGANNKWGFFPSASLGWRISEEPFLKKMTKISNLKLRVSYGQTGNSNIGSNAFSFYDVNNRYAFGSVTSPGVQLTQLSNSNLKWETSTELNVGLDFGFLKNRIAGSIEIFNKITSDLLSWRDLRSWNIVSSVASNLGNTESKGVELTLNTVNIDNHDFKWNTDFTFTRYQDRWKKRSPDAVLNPWDKVNDPIRAVYYYKTVGIVQLGQTVAAQPNAVPGNIIVQDINGFDSKLKYTGKPDGKIDQADIVYLGTLDPDFSIGFNNTFKYKNFDLNMYAYGSFNQLVYNSTLIKYIGYSSHMVEDGTNLRVEAKKMWSSVNQTGIYPSDAVNTTMGSDAYAWEKASFLRIKNLTLGYNFPKKWLGKEISSLRIYADVQNPFIITNWTGMDPETDGNGKAPYPNQKSYSIGFNLQF
ncbi:TonB-dependent receptor [uncultured Bacteroides sp.]|uniref:SusC/RagA family TonB-linked outer membrane protein n=1 Tax=uncultured Bacteroides sp. TaxID=162156 RepID=UPI002AAC25ED|nr:TonB-dependent receptor [uncultured Bacteroides sp.]